MNDRNRIKKTVSILERCYHQEEEIAESQDRYINSKTNAMTMTRLSREKTSIST